LEDWRAVNRELKMFDPELMEKPQIVVANKIDIPEARANADVLAKKLPRQCKPLHRISAVTGEGVKAVVRRIGALLDEMAVLKEDERDAEGI
jgi:GTP-binding protein